MAEKKYYWLRLRKDFFNQPKIKKLRRVAGGDTYTVIYLKLQLLSIDNDGMILFEGIEDDFIDEMALTIDEDVDNVRFTIMYLISQGLMQEVDVDEYLLPEAKNAIGSETEAAERMRKMRKNNKKMEEKRNDVTQMLHESYADVTNCYTEKEIEIDKDKDKEKETDKDKETEESYDIKREFESLWELYPRKQGKANALKAYVKERKVDSDAYKKVMNGINAYVKYIEKAKIEKRYIKQGSTWFNQKCWEDDYTMGDGDSGTNKAGNEWDGFCLGDFV